MLGKVELLFSSMAHLLFSFLPLLRLVLNLLLDSVRAEVLSIEWLAIDSKFICVMTSTNDFFTVDEFLCFSLALLILGR